MTHLSGTAPRTLPRAAAIHSHNGGPPAPSPLPRIAIVVGAAFLVGALVARLLDWRSHAHPRD